MSFWTWFALQESLVLRRLTSRSIIPFSMEVIDVARCLSSSILELRLILYRFQQMKPTTMQQPIFCTRCGARAVGNAIFCSNCGAPLLPQPQPPSQPIQVTQPVTPPVPSPSPMPVRAVGTKNVGVATILSLVFPGLGQLYVGEKRKGIALVLLTIILGFIAASLDLGFTMIIYWVYNIVDAYQTAKQYNAYVLQTGRSP
jgi:TM2 domain-containing membrane protein YozV